jgi:1-acyl-sn-glycerol-3-phosphate acyltransferase
METMPKDSIDTAPAPPEVVRLRSERLCAFFERVMRRQMARSFHAVRLAEPGVPRAVLDLPPERPLIVYSNHPSWWDPAFAMVMIPRQFEGRACFGPIEAAMLERYGFFRRIGLFGVEPGTRAGAATFLRTSRAVLAEPSRMLWVTAQGTFADPRERPVRLRPGVARLMAALPDAVALPCAFEYPFWTEAKPEALARFGEPLEGAHDAAEWNRRLEEALGRTMDALARDAMLRDPSPFRDLLRGQSGIGGVYDLWRRGRALLRGERFRAEHMPIDRKSNRAVEDPGC